MSCDHPMCTLHAPCMLSCYHVLVHVSCTLVPPSVQVKISDQTYSIGAIMGKDPTDVKEAKSSRINTQIDQVDIAYTKYRT